jgi:hypothetical protein
VRSGSPLPDDGWSTLYCEGYCPSFGGVLSTLMVVRLEESLFSLVRGGTFLVDEGWPPLTN